MNLFNFLEFLNFWHKIGRKYEAIKNDPQKSQTSTSLGTTSIIMSIVGIVLTVGLAVLAFYCYLGMQTLAFLFAIIGAVFCAFGAFICFVELVLASVVYAFYQLKLNKMTIGKVAIAVSLFLSVATIVAVIVALTQFPALD